MEISIANNIISGISRILNSQPETVSEKIYDKDVCEIKDRDFILFNLIIERFFKGFERVVIQSKTKPRISLAFEPIAFQKLLKAQPGLDPFFISEFKSLNQKTYIINKEGFKLGNIKTIGYDLYNSHSAENINWKTFFRIFPEAPGIIQFSKPYFNEANNLAVIEFLHLIPEVELCTTLVAFTKSDLKWEISYHRELG